jgi:hypothetical protein
MPIFEIVLSRPLPSPLTTCFSASSASVTPGMRPSTASSSTVSKSRYGLTALAP